MHISNQRGFAYPLLIVLIALGLLGGGAYYVISQDSAAGGLMLSEEARMEMEKEGIMIDTDMQADAMIGGDAMKDTSGDTMMEKDDAAMMEQSDESMMQDDSGAMMETDAMMQAYGSYEPYAAEKLARASTGDVVLFFRASWCPTCRALDADIKANATDIPAGVTILDVNYDTQTDLKRKYNVTYQHTMVQVDAEGNQIAKWSGSPTLASILNNIK